MARVNWRFSLLACVLILVNVAGLVWIHRVVTRAPKPTVRVLAALPMDTADRADRFTLVFDRRVVPPRSVGKVEAAAIFRLEPAWPGQWVWAAQDTVEYRLGKPLPAGRVFLLSATGELRARTGRRLEGKRKRRSRCACGSPGRSAASRTCRRSASPRRWRTSASIAAASISSSPGASSPAAPTS